MRYRIVSRALWMAFGGGSLFLLLRMFPFDEESPLSSSLASPHLRTLNSLPSNKISKTAIVDLERLVMNAEVENMSLCPRWFEMISALKSCYISRTIATRHLWNEISNISTLCGSDYLKNLLRSKYIINRDDVKAIIPPRKAEMVFVSLTVGIGNDTSVERRLQKIMPKIRLYGIDPVFEDGRRFADIGEYLQMGVSERGGRLNASVLEGGRYVWKEIETVSLQSAVRMFRLTDVDFLFLDVEGAEYSILPAIGTQDGFENITFCQINVELHGPLEKYGASMRSFARVLRAIFANESPYIPLWIPPPTSHHRFLLVNWKHPHCINRYFSHWC